MGEKSFLGFLYTIKCKTNNKLYVGITNDVAKRWNKHVYDTKHNSPCVIHRAMKKYGIDNFSIIVLQQFISKEDLCANEILFIKILNSHVSVGGYNETFGGEAPMMGRKHSAESRKLMSKKLKGRISPNKGKKASSQTKKLLSKSHSKMVEQLDLDGKIIATHDSIIAAGRSVGIAGSNISGVCLNKKKTAAGFRWQYSEKK